MREYVPVEATLGSAKAISGVDHNPTVEENIDARINHLRKEIERLERSKVDLAPLLKVRIRDVRSAMELY